MKNRIALGVIVLGIGASLTAGIAEIGTEVFKSTKTYGKDTKIGFELINKGQIPIWFGIRNGDTIATTETGSFVQELKPEFKSYQDLDIKKDTALALWLADPGKAVIKLDKTKPGGISFKADTDPYFIYTFPIGKTLYLTWARSPEGYYVLREQTGPLKGLLGKTDTGLSLREPGNVKQADIKIVFEKQFQPQKA